MKQIIYLITILFLSVGAVAQSPQLISYQAVVRNSSNVLVANSTVGVAISIVKDSANGTTVYSELQTASTNGNGLFSIVIGNGLFASGSIAAINWGNGVYYIKSQIDPNGGINFTISGTTQLLSVPYALYAANGNPAGKNKGDLQYWDGSKWVVLPAGANGTVLTMANGVPTWTTPTTTPTTTAAPTVTTISAAANSSTTATVYGLVTANGGATVTARGFCWSTSNASPTLSDNNKTGTFTTAAADTFYASLSSLTASTTYYVRAYATNSVGTSYGSPLSITTPSATTTPTVSLLSAVAPVFTPGVFVAGYGAGLLVSNGGSAVTAQGICWSTSPSPTLSNFYIGGTFVATRDTFNTTLSGMNPSSPTTYYLRAYATNSVGTSYSNQITLQVPGYVTSTTAPTVSTLSASSTGATSGSLSGIISATGGTTITAQGFCWSSTNSTPSLLDNIVSGTIVTPGSDTFYASLSNLANGTTYYVRAYATNSVGISYGSTISFTASSGTTGTHKVGDSYGGGTVFYVDGTGHGLIAALGDQGNVPWDLSSSGSFKVTGATDTSVGSGAANTATIKTALSSSGSYAANLAAQTANGYSDWYLPSLGELQLMYINLATSKLGNLSPSNVYWSSSEYLADSSHQAWVKDFGHNSIYGYWKSNNAYVRAVRKF